MDPGEASKLEAEEVAKFLQTDLLIGLTSFEARERLKKHGSNKLDDESDTKTVPKFIYQSILEYFSQFMNPLIQLLLICVIVSAVIGEYESAISVSISILIVCTISYIQERRADKSLEKLNKKIPNICEVIREGQVHELESHYLVPGDIIYLSEGQRVPADLRLFDVHLMTINEANLTGETQSQSKTAKPLLNEFVPAFTAKADVGSISIDRNNTNDGSFIPQNLALMGTMVESGNSRGVVILTGKSTRYGEVYSMLKNTQQPRSPLQVNIDQLSIHLVIGSLIIITVMSILGIVQRRSTLDVAYYAVSLAVTSIPEGLPVVVAVILALGVLRLTKQKTIVRSLNAIETLGCVQVLCADKTGTLTRNDMNLTDIVTSELHSLSSSELEELNNEENKKHMTFNKFGGKLYSIGRLMEVGTLCNNASFDPDHPETIGGHYSGQATDCALLEAAMRMGYGDSRTKYDRISEIPFTSKSRRMVVQCQRLDLTNNGPMYYVKGAWEDILNECEHYYDCGLIKPKTDEMWVEYARICTTFGSQGLRVLALATGPTLEQLTFVGLVGINNSLRQNIVETVDQLRNTFYIDVKMITGDSKCTAIAVARAIGIIENTDYDHQVMSGEDLQGLLDSTEIEEMDKATEICSKKVFYRIDPIQKSKIVGKLQEANKIVAMTGDGVNDVISLKQSNLSLVMGSGADICKEVADIILLEDDLSLLVQALIEGKGIYHKIHSFMSYQISISLSLLILVAASYASKIQSPYTVVQILFINILADGPPAQSLSVERVSMKDLNPKPRNARKSILDTKLLGSIFVLTSTIVAVNGSLYYYLVS